jgi:tetratricopeptide (TPR) repeat protein
VAEFRENWPEAQKHLKSWLALDPNNATAMQRMAACLVPQKKVTEALDELQRAARSDPRLATPEVMLAQMCEQAGDRENARKYMIHALTAAPKDVKIRLAAARWAFETGNLVEAKQQVEWALKLDEKSLDAMVLRGVIAIFQKDYRTAEAYLNEANLQAHGENFPASNNLALALAEQKDENKRKRALKLAEDNLSHFQKTPDAISTYGWVLYRMGRLDEAEKYLRAAASMGAIKPDTLYNLAQLYADRKRPGDAAEAKKWLEGALRVPGPFAMREEAKALLEQLSKQKTTGTDPSIP